MPANFSLAKALDYLLGEKSISTELRALAYLPVIGLLIWFLATRKFPTPEEDSANARQYYSISIIKQKRLNARGEPVLVVAQGTLVTEEIDWGGSFFSPELTSDNFPVQSREAYLRIEQHSLVAYAVAGDSLLKKRGALTAVIKRGQKIQTFDFHSLWK